MSDDNHDNLRVAYDQLCNSIRAIDEFRAKLLALLPLASGAGIFLLLSDALDPGGAVTTRPLTGRFLAPIGAFGFAITLGLYFYEIRGIQYCTHLIAAGKELERRLDVPGIFSTRPRSHAGGFVSEIAAAHIIYAAVLGAWSFVMTVFAWPFGHQGPAIVPASLVAMTVFIVVLRTAHGIDLRPQATVEPSAHRRGAPTVT